MDPQWTLSIVLMTRNRADSARQCLGSLVAQRGDPARFEIVVIDDGSVDETAGVVAEHSRGPVAVQYWYQAASGIATARNAGIARARGHLIAFVADDYVLPTDYVDTVTRFFRESPGAACVRFRMTPAHQDLISRAGHFQYEVDLRNSLGARRPRSAAGTVDLRTLFRRLPEFGLVPTTDHRMAAAGAAAFRRRVFDEIGRFDARWVRGEDTELTTRLRTAGMSVHFHPGVVVRRAYERTLSTALRKHWVAGYHAERLAQAGASGGPVLPRLFGHLIRGFGLPFWRARQADSLMEALVVLPLLGLFEMAYRAGAIGVCVRGTTRA